MIDYGGEFAGTRVLITGADGLIGTWTAEAFGAQGAELLLTDAREEPLAALGERLGAHTAVADLGTGAGVAALTKALDARWPTADILVDNAPSARGRRRPPRTGRRSSASSTSTSSRRSSSPSTSSPR